VEMLALMNVMSVMDQVSDGTKENAIVQEKFMIVKELAEEMYVKITAVFAVVKELISLKIIVIVSVINLIVTISAVVLLL